MGYTESLFTSGETLVRDARQHWFVLIWNTRWAILALLLAFLLVTVRAVNGGTGPVFDFLGIVTFLMFVYGIAAIVWGYLRYRNEEYVISTRRLIHVEGVINKKATDSSLEKINDAILTESIFGRVFGFGDLEVLTASESGISRLRMLTDAKDFKKAMLEAKHDLELELSRPTMPPLRTASAPADTDAAMTPDRFEPTSAQPPAEPAAPAPAPALAPVTAPATQPDAPSPPVAPTMTSEQVADALSRLGDLRDRGIVTPEEFAAKKAELLARL
jgi:hypothetical protein